MHVGLGDATNLAPYFSSFFPTMPAVLNSGGVPVNEITGATIQYLGPVDAPARPPGMGTDWMTWLRKNQTLVFAGAATVFALAIARGRR
jgi:hypothetical protein